MPRFLSGLATLALPLALLACVSPSPDFAGAQERRVTLDGTEFAVFVKGDRVQAIRMGYAIRTRQRTLPATLVAAIEQATACTIRPGTAKGDSGVMNARLDC